MQNITAIVDQLGELKAKLADLNAQEAELKSILIASGQEVIEGHLFRVSISQVARSSRDTTFKDAIEDLIATHLSRQFITAHTGETVSPVVRVSARKGVLKVAA